MNSTTPTLEGKSSVNAGKLAAHHTETLVITQLPPGRGGGCRQSATMRSVLLPLAAGLTWLGLSTAHAVVNGQLDDFESGSVLNWGNGGAAPDPQNIANGGPLGTGDNFLRITSDGDGAAGKLTAYNRVQWAGATGGVDNYIAAGVTLIEMDLKNFGSAPLTIRIAFRTGTGQFDPGYVSTTGFSLAVGSEWQHASFSLSDMNAANGSPGTLNSVLSNPAEMRILHSVAPNTVRGDPFAGTLGVDNIVAIPEPTSGGLLALGLGALALHRRIRI